ncbi:MAG: hypothetical protein HYV77_00655 [Candidatus Wildermuthbacteria bacterium]|nr:hypothetical protein [Candidatus Wildermuthbacteria bacterium]
MKIFEFYFNPTSKGAKKIETFTFEPQTAKEETKGKLCMAGELDDSMPANATFLKKLAAVIKEEYYKHQSRTKKNPIIESSLQSALKKANQFLKAEAKKGNTQWLGNLHFAVLVIAPASENTYFSYFAKCGSVRLWIARNGKLTDIGKSIDSPAVPKDPAAVFGNIAGGKVVGEDRIFIATKEVADALSRGNTLRDVAAVQDQKRLKAIFKKKEKELLQTMGAFLFVLVSGALEEVAGGAKKPPYLLANLPSLLETMDIQRFLPKQSVLAKLPGGRLLLSAPKISSKLSVGRFALILLGVVVFAAGIGFAVQKNINLNLGADSNSKAVQERVEALVIASDSALGASDEQKANELLHEALSYIKDAEQKTKDKGAMNALVLEKDSIEKKLREINKIEKIENPEIVFDVNSLGEGRSYSYIVVAGESAYLFTDGKNEAVSIAMASREGALFDLPLAPFAGVSKDNKAVFFLAVPNVITEISGRAVIKEQALRLPANFTFNLAASYDGNLYGLDNATGRVLLYRNPTQSQVQPFGWLKPTSSQKPVGASALAVDGSLWTMKEGNELSRYYKGDYQESFSIEVYPTLANVSAIATNSEIPYIVMLEKTQRRIIVVNKSGALLRQYISDAFDAIQDISLAQNGKILYVLSGTKVYAIQIEL